MSVTKEVCEWLNTKAAKENLDLSTELDIFKAECDRLGSGYDAAQSELAALREELAKANKRNSELEVFEKFAGYLLDHCEGEPIYEESLQYWLSESIKMYKPTESGASE